MEFLKLVQIEERERQNGLWALLSALLGTMSLIFAGRTGTVEDALLSVFLFLNMAICSRFLFAKPYSVELHGVKYSFILLLVLLFAFTMVLISHEELFGMPQLRMFGFLFGTGVLALLLFIQALFALLALALWGYDLFVKKK